MSDYAIFDGAFTTSVADGDVIQSYAGAFLAAPAAAGDIEAALTLLATAAQTGNCALSADVARGLGVTAAFGESATANVAVGALLAATATHGAAVSALLQASESLGATLDESPAAAADYLAAVVMATAASHLSLTDAETIEAALALSADMLVDLAGQAGRDASQVMDMQQSLAQLVAAARNVQAPLAVSMGDTCGALADLEGSAEFLAALDEASAAVAALFATSTMLAAVADAYKAQGKEIPPGLQAVITAHERRSVDITPATVTIQ